MRPWPPAEPVRSRLIALTASSLGSRSVFSVQRMGIGYANGARTDHYAILSDYVPLTTVSCITNCLLLPDFPLNLMESEVSSQGRYYFLKFPRNIYSQKLTITNNSTVQSQASLNWSSIH